MTTCVQHGGALSFGSRGLGWGHVGAAPGAEIWRGRHLQLLHWLLQFVADVAAARIMQEVRPRHLKVGGTLGAAFCWGCYVGARSRGYRCGNCIAC